MKIILIDPPFYRLIDYYNRHFPLGIAYLGAILKKNGHDVLIYDVDCNVNPSKMELSCLEESYPLYLKSLTKNHPIGEEILQRIRSFEPDIVGITTWTTFVASSFKIAALCKMYNKNILVVLGGPHITIKWDEVIKVCPDVDILVRGEGEGTFLELVETFIKENKLNFTTLKNVKGIVYRDNGNIVCNPEREFIKDLDVIPFPARELLINKNSYNSEDMGLLMTSRGCPFSCSYCATGIWKRKVRYRSIDNVVEEMRLVRDTYRTRQFTIKDDSFTVNRKRILEFCDRLVSENLNIN